MKNKYWLLRGIVGGILSLSIACAHFYTELELTHSESGLPLAEMEVNGETLKVEVAESDREQAYGLMNRYILPKNAGMLFVFHDYKARSFWMKNTKIPLDIIYIDDKGEVVAIKHAVPCKKDPCPSYPSIKPAQYVLELAKGEAARLGIVEGYQFSKNSFE